MFNHGLYPFVPSLKNARALVAVLWILGVLFILIGLCAAETSAGAAPAPAGSSSLTAAEAFQSPLATPVPRHRATPARQSPISGVSPAYGAKNVPPGMPLTITFRGHVDRAAIEHGLVIKPHIDGKFVWDEDTMAFVPAGGWEPGVTYRITLRLEEQWLLGRWLFSVEPVIGQTQPAPNGTLWWEDEVKIEFLRPMDRASVEAAFSIQPDVRGVLRWEDTALVFKPGEEWRVGTRYAVTLSPTLKTTDGKPVLRSPFRLSFSTPAEQGRIHFGWGPKVQVVNPGGRRAVQFEASGTLRPIAVRLHALTIEQFLDRYTSMFRGIGPSEEKHIRADDLPIVREWRHALSTRNRDYGMAEEMTLPADLSPGLYVLTIDHPTAGSDELIVIYTRYTLVLKQAEGQIGAWASAIGGGSIPDMHIRIYDRDATLVAEGRTDAQGLFTTNVPVDPQPLIVVGERDGEITASGLSNEWEQGGWYGWWQPAPKADRTQAYIYTDRPIYRPGQTVHAKIVARYDNDAVYSRIPLEWDVIVRLRDARNNVVSEQTLHLNEYGTLNTSFALAEGGTVGAYHVEAQIKDDVHRQAIKVEEYRKPEYEVSVRVSRANLVNGEPVSVTVEARTYFGAPAANARVELATYTRMVEWWWYGDEDAGGLWSPLGNALSGVTDANGRWTARLTPKVDDYRYGDYVHSLPVLVEATIKDGSGQSVSAHAQATVHDAALGLSISLPHHAYRPGQSISVGVFATDVNGNPRVDEAVTAEVLGWSHDGFKRVLASAKGQTSADGSAALTLKVTEQGWYQLRVAGRDEHGRRVERLDWLWVYDPERDLPWYIGDSSELQISADKSSYLPGETAQLMIRTPVEGAALLTFERGKLRRAQVVELTAPTTIVPVTIQDDDAPNVHVAVNVYRLTGADVKPDWQSIPEADLLVARTNLSVSAEQRRLVVTVTPDRSVYGPRDEAAFTIQVTGADGAPAQAEVSLALVDEAIFALSEELVADPFEAFYGERPGIVRTYDALRPIRWLGGGMGGGGGGGDLLGNPRMNFPDTAYWNPAIVTDAEGRATVKVRLPDSLTRWRAVARATTADEFPRVGQATAAITTTQPIVIRPALPRQLVQGDQVLLSAVIHNNTGQMQDARVWMEIEPRMNTDNTDKTDGMTQTVVISPNGSVVVGWPVTASTLGAITTTLSAQSGDDADAVRMSLPVVPLAAPDVHAVIGEVTTSVEEAVDLPAGTIGEASSLTIDLSPSIAASVLDGLAYLTGYPFGCVEQTMSKALPNAVVGRALAVLGINNPALRADLPGKVSAGLQRLYGYQHNDGGWGWWFDDSSDDYQTAYVLFGLAMTKQAGYLVDDGVIERGASYLKERLPQIADKRTKAYALFALALAGHGEMAATQQLAGGDAEDLDPFSRAALAIALHELGDEARAQTMIDTLVEEAIASDGQAHWETGIEDGHYRHKTMSSSTRSTALALDALARVRPDDPLVTQVVRWLMGRRTATGWGTTQETAYAVVALTDYLRSSNELVAGSTYRVFVDGVLAGEGSLAAGQMQTTIVAPATQLQAGQHRVRIERSGAPGRLYYKVTLRAMIAGSADKAAGRIKITREYLDAKTNKPIASVRAGDVVKVRLSVTLPQESWYVAIEDPLPGGLEGLNERLNTTSYAARAGYTEEGSEFFYQEYGYNNKEVRDDRVVFFVTQMRPGRHTFTYLARATQAGTFSALPVQVYLMYEPEQWGRSASSTVSVYPVDELSSP
ncbi:MAG TPA: MG2 domain-containing protein [Anaerolineae bacterium]|nr:MG2 domain-containing protein [Anaerolineae bacterium]